MLGYTNYQTTTKRVHLRAALKSFNQSLVYQQNTIVLLRKIILKTYLDCDRSRQSSMVGNRQPNVIVKVMNTNVECWFEPVVYIVAVTARDTHTRYWITVVL